MFTDEQLKKEKKIQWEWDIEECFYNGDDWEIEDHNHTDKLVNSAYDHSVIDGRKLCLVLIRDVTNNDLGVMCRSWAYAINKNGFFVLPERTDAGYKIPGRFHKELEKWQNNTK